MRKGLITVALAALALSGSLTQAHHGNWLAPGSGHHNAGHAYHAGHGSHGTRLFSPEQAAALYSDDQQHGLAACAGEFPGGHALPLTVVNAKMNPLGLCSNRFAVIYSPRSRTPLLVVERLDRERLQDATGEDRTDNFYPDPRLPADQRAELSDYKGSGYDRGHQSPAADQPDVTAMEQSFALSNMVPQDPDNNHKIWNKLEQDVRKFAKRAPGSIYVFTGPLFAEDVTTIGDNQVWVPAQLFKLVYDEDAQRAWAYVLDNTADARIEKPMDYARFVKLTHLALLPGVKLSGSIAAKAR